MGQVKGKLQTLVEIEGFNSDIECAEEFFNSGTVPGICMNPGCNTTYLYEPDQKEGFCEECRTNTVQSLFILMGIM